MAEWAVVEFDADQEPIWSFGPYEEDEARERFEFVLRQRSQRSDVVLRGRSAALLHRGQVVEAASIRRSKRAPLIGDKRLHHLNIETREALFGLELLAARLAASALRVDGSPRLGAGWERVRAAACDLWDLVRGSSAQVSECVDGWWLQEWACGCHQVEREPGALPDTCPYHDAPTQRPATFVDRGWVKRHA